MFITDGITSKAQADIIHERHRQIGEEGWDSEHDKSHSFGELSAAAACYALPEGLRTYEIVDCFGGNKFILTPVNWPWAANAWKPQSPRRDLVRAAALLIAEIERMDALESELNDE